jgi:hypothetical protein
VYNVLDRIIGADYLQKFKSSVFHTVCQFSPRMLKFNVTFLILLAFQLVAIEGHARYKFLNASCIAVDPKTVSVHACEAEGYSLNLSLTINRRLFKPVNVRYKDVKKACNI